MQTRKRAKSVSFGRASKPKTIETAKEEKVASHATEQEKKVTTSDAVESKAAAKIHTPAPKVIETEAAKKVTQAEPILSATPTVPEKQKRKHRKRLLRL